MDLELVTRHISKLPADDDHPYRTGAWRPQTGEWNADDMEVIGHIPEDLDGVYLRNTENPLLPSMKLYHPFDGDGMVHLMGFRGGKAFYRNRFVHTDGFKAEQQAGEALWAGLAEPPSLTKVGYGWGARGFLKDSSSTDVVVHGGEVLTTFYQCGDLYRLSGTTLETLGKQDWHGQFPSASGISAHPKVDEHTGEMMFFNYGVEAPYMHYGVVDRDNNLVNYCDIPLPGPRLSHDMAITANYSIVNDCPLFWDPEALKVGKYATRFFRDVPTRIGVIPRYGKTADLRWFEFEPTYVLHWLNAYEEGDWVVLDGFFQKNPSPVPPSGGTFYERIFRYLGQEQKEPRLHRWRMNLRTGESTEHDLTDVHTEFGMVNGLHTGRKHRYAYAATRVDGVFLFDGFVKHDTETGRVETVQLPPGVFGSETAMAPRVGSTSEDDGYVITLTSDVNEDKSECLIFDAQDVTAGPVARIRLPERVSSGTHSTWAPGSAIHGWDHVENPIGAVRL
ncbi:carotenoid oxygenase family protein [Streptosporangium sp. NPDC087985]|uniref:carotenoid oxygenase family protein n=1 Tax=Streptosporangium sp. NPDC087985 TaxID=3366196 RepID=UPI00381457A3